MQEGRENVEKSERGVTFLPGHRWRRGTVGKHRALGNEEDSGDDESWFPNASWTRAFAGGPWLAALLRPPYPRSHSTCKSKETADLFHRANSQIPFFFIRQMRIESETRSD